MLLLATQSGEMDINPIAFAIPIFLVAIIIEAIIARARRKRDGVTEAYNFGTAMSDLTVGTVFQGVDVLFQLLTFTAYVWLFDNYNMVDWGDNTVAKWAVAMLGVDLMFYWWHRASHVINFMWAVHGVHHQSEDFNLAVALRQPTFEPLTWFLFYAPLAFVGIDPLTYLAAYGINRFYQFWIHTELVDKLGPLEYVLNTPSHHRVHHGVQDQYLDKNYGAILIIWDFLFRSFEKEDERVIYGTTTPLRSLNPVWANFAIFARIGRLMKVATSPLQWLWAPFAHPAWLPGTVDPDAHLPKRVDCDKYQPPASNAAIVYVAIHFLAMGGVMFIFLLHEPKWNLPQLALGSFATVAASMAFCGILERRPWAWPLEVVRLCATVAAIYWLGSTRYDTTLVTMAAAATATGSLVGLLFYGLSNKGSKDEPSQEADVEASAAEHQAAE